LSLKYLELCKHSLKAKVGKCNSPLDIFKACLPYFKNICIPCY
jgi:hypothetical protein